MAVYGRGSREGFVADNSNRVAISGKNALIIELVRVSPSSDVVYVLNSNATQYATGHPLITTGTAIVTNMFRCENAQVTPEMATGAPTTTTAMRPPVVKYINGATTLIAVWTKGLAAAGGSGVRIALFGFTR
jgi:hypothetical protein